MKSKSIILGCFSVILTIKCFATWSIIVVDPKTNEIGIAGASCTYSVYGIGAIVPGKGAIVVQAMSNPLARGLGIRMILADAPVEKIMDALQNPDFDPQEQQYAVICVKELAKPMTFTGKETPDQKGAITADGISVQGNTLANTNLPRIVLDAALAAQKKSLPIEEVLMLALEAGSALGGDRRCEGTTASSAFLSVSKPEDPRGAPSLNLIVYGNDEKLNAVSALRKKLIAWKKENGLKGMERHNL